MRYPVAMLSLALANRSCTHPWSWLRPDPYCCRAPRAPTLHANLTFPVSRAPLIPPPSPFRSTPSFPPLEIVRHPRPAVGRVAVWHDILVRGAGFPVASICRGQVEAEGCSRRFCLWRMYCWWGWVVSDVLQAMLVVLDKNAGRPSAVCVVLVVVYGGRWVGFCQRGRPPAMHVDKWSCRLCVGASTMCSVI